MRNNLTVIFFLISSIAWSQNAVVGTVTDAETGEGLIGVTVQVENTTKGVITDIDGSYSLSLSEKDKALVYSYIGYQSKTVEVGNRSKVDVSLNIDIQQLSEVVVVGYGVQEKVNLTGAIENIELDDVENRAITNSSQILQGKVSGVQITQNSGQPGQDGASIRIRGVSSINNSNDPLVIIDGIQGVLEDVHPNDIETMTVLKDASSAAIYGARASAGVILITTKQQKKELRLTYNGTFSIQNPTALPDPINSATYAERYNEARINTGFPASFTEDQIANYQEGIDPRFPSTNWYDVYFKDNTWMQNHYLSVGGGQKNYDFTISGGYLDQEGILIGTESDKLTYRVKFNSRFLNEKLRVNTIISGYDQEDNELTSSTSSVLTSLAGRRPFGVVRAIDSLTGQPGLYGAGAVHLANLENGGGSKYERDNFKYQVELQVEPIKGLVGSFLHSKNTSTLDYTRLVPSVITAGNIFDPIGTVTRSSLTNRNTTNITDQSTLTLKYDKDIGKHNLNVLFGAERLAQSVEGMEASINDLIANQPVFSLGDPSTYFLRGEARVRTLQSVFARLNYIFDDRYLFEANVRKDGSSRFTKGSQYGVFPSLSLGWRIANESFFNPNFISDLKLRGSWGLLGNEFIGEFYPQFSKLSPNQNYSFGGVIVPGTAITDLAANNVTWEKVEQINIGLDMTIKDRLDLMVNIFQKTSTDNLIAITVPRSLGIDNDPFQNVGEMINKGVEMSLGFRSNPSKKFVYSLNLNGAFIENEVADLGPVDFVNHTNFISGYQPDPTTIRSQVGHPFASYYGFVAEGIYQVNDFTWQNDSDPEVPHEERIYALKDEIPDPSGLFASVAPGDIIFRDTNGDGILTVEDKKIIGNSQPRLTYAFTFNASYSNFDLSLLIQGVGKTDAYLTGALIAPFWNGSGNISQDLAENRWTIENQSEEFQRLHVDAQRSNIISSYYVQDASYTRIKNIQIGYSFPTTLTNKLKLGSFRVFASVENLMTFTNFSGFDPERGFNKITGDFHPLMRITSMGVQARF